METSKPISSSFVNYDMQTIYKTISSQWGVIYDQFFNSSFHQKLQSIEYSAVLALTGTSREKVYQDLGLESLQQR